MLVSMVIQVIRNEVKLWEDYLGSSYIVVLVSGSDFFKLFQQVIDTHDWKVEENLFLRHLFSILYINKYILG